MTQTKTSITQTSGIIAIVQWMKPAGGRTELEKENKINENV